jgi:hypothetical protein
MLKTLSARDAAGFAADAGLAPAKEIEDTFRGSSLAKTSDTHALIRSDREIETSARCFVRLSEARAANRALRVKADCDRSSPRQRTAVRLSICRDGNNLSIDK